MRFKRNIAMLRISHPLITGIYITLKINMKLLFSINSKHLVILSVGNFTGKLKLRSLKFCDQNIVKRNSINVTPPLLSIQLFYRLFYQCRLIVSKKCPFYDLLIHYFLFNYIFVIRPLNLGWFCGISRVRHLFVAIA